MKRIIAAILSILTCFLTACGVGSPDPPTNEISKNIEEMTEDEIKTEVLEYLKNTYDREFVILESKEKYEVQADTVTAETNEVEYVVAPKINEDIVFVAGVKEVETQYSKTDPPVTEKRFYDTYYNDARSYVVKQFVTPHILRESDTPDKVAQYIYSLMFDINTELRKLGIKTNITTCAFSMTFIKDQTETGQKEKIVNFTEQNYDTILATVKAELFLTK